MARPLRIEFPGAIYHVTARGNRCEPIFAEDADRDVFLGILGAALARFDAVAFAYCLMGNHYHCVVHTRQANLSALMRQVNGVYTQAFNRRHGKVGHLFQGRFKSILVDRDAYLLEVCRYVDLNPVRAGLVEDPGAWDWSSYRAHVGLTVGPNWLDSLVILGQLLGRDVRDARDRRRASARYAEFVARGHDVRLWDQALKAQIYLGDEDFVARMQTQLHPSRVDAVDIPNAQRRSPPMAIELILKDHPRDDAIARAFQSGHSMTAIARAVGLSVSRISRIVRTWEEERAKLKT